MKRDWSARGAIKKREIKKKCNLLKSFIIVDFFFLAEKENKIL